MPFARRDERDLERGRQACAAARAKGATAMEAALAQIGAAFGEAAEINEFKLRVEQILKLGPHHAAVRARFGPRAELLMGRSLATATTIVERWWREERKAFQIASALGCGTRLSLEVLRELRLILRLVRYRAMDAEYDAILAALCEQPIAMAAE